MPADHSSTGEIFSDGCGANALSEALRILWIITNGINAKIEKINVSKATGGITNVTAKVNKNSPIYRKNTAIGYTSQAQLKAL